MAGTVGTESGSDHPELALRAILDEIPLMIAHWDGSVRNVLANRAFATWFGVSAESLHGTHLGDLLPADVYDTLLPHVSATLTGRPSEVDLPMYAPSGTLRYLSIALVPHLVGSEVQGLFMTCTDGTDRVRAQEAERRSAHEVATYLERQRISDRLHEEALQELFGAMLALTPKHDDPVVASSIESIERAIGDLRALLDHEERDADQFAGGDTAPWRVRELVEVLNKLPAAVAFWDNDLRVRFSNTTSNVWLGTTEPPAFGTPAQEYLGPALYQANLPLMRSAVQGEEQRFVRTMQGDGVEHRVVQFSYVPNRVNGTVDGFFVLGSDLTELVRARSTLEETRADVDRATRAYLTLAQANQAILRAQDDLTLHQELCRISVEAGGYLGAWVAQAGPDGKVIALAQAGAMDDYIAQLDITVDADDPRGQGPTGIALREGRTVYSENFMADPATTPWRGAAHVLGIAASATIPLRRSGTTVAALNLYSTDPTHFSQQMRGLMEGLADNVSFALTALDERRRLRLLPGVSTTEATPSD